MRDQEIVGLYEAYASIYAPKEEEVVEEVEQLDEGPIETIRKAGEALGRGVAGAAPAVEKGLKQGGEAIERFTGGAIKVNKTPKPTARNEEVETDLFDYILEYLVAEGYADTNENALVIMANMSEDWRESIVEEVLDEAEGSYGQTPKARQAYGDLANKRRTTPASGFSKRGEKTKKVDAATKHFYRTGNPDAGNRGKKSTKSRYTAGRQGFKMTQKDRDHSRGEAEYGHTGYDPDWDGGPSAPGGKPKGKKLERQKKTGVSA